MPQLNEVLIPIDENQTLESIMGMGTNNQMNPQMNNLEELYANLSNRVKERVSNENQSKPKKARAKPKAKQTATPTVPVHTPTAIPKVINDTKQQKEKLILKISKYQNSERFGGFIKKDLKITQSREQLIKLSIEKLNAILHRIRLNLNNRNLDKIFETLAVTGAKGYEKLVSEIGFNINGFSDLLVANPGFWDAFERWKIERELPDIPPGIQLAYIISATTLAAYNINTMKQGPPQLPTKEKKEEKIKKQKQMKVNKDKKSEKYVGNSTFSLNSDLKI